MSRKYRLQKHLAVAVLSITVHWHIGKKSTKTVSYTHLDVYKRQDQVGTDGSNGAAFAKDILDWILKNATTCLLYTSM